jgi:hypothetical protein
VPSTSLKELKAGDTARRRAKRTAQANQRIDAPAKVLRGRLYPKDFRSPGAKAFIPIGCLLGRPKEASRIEYPDVSRQIEAQRSPNDVT